MRIDPVTAHGSAVGRSGGLRFSFGAFDDTGRVRNVKIWAPSATLQDASFFTAK